MSALDQALQTQLKNIQAKTGKTLDELIKLVKSSGMSKHGEIRDMLKRDLALGHGDANTLTHVALKSDGASQAEGKSGGEVLDEIYSGAKAGLRSAHEKLMEAIQKFGEFEIAPKKGYISLRRKKQLAMIGPGTNSRVDLGLNLKDAPRAGRLEALPPKGMCSHRLKLTAAGEVDKEVIAWVKQAYDAAG